MYVIVFVWLNYTIGNACNINFQMVLLLLFVVFIVCFWSLVLENREYVRYVLCLPIHYKWSIVLCALFGRYNRFLPSLLSDTLCLNENICAERNADSGYCLNPFVIKDRKLEMNECD